METEITNNKDLEQPKDIVNRTKDLETKNLFGYWGAFYTFGEESEPRMIWIGPMRWGEMIQHFEKFRHNFRLTME